MKLDVVVPIEVSRGLNDREHYRVRAKRVKAEREAVNLALCDAFGAEVFADALVPRAGGAVTHLASRIKPGARVTLLRPYARVPLDSDNLSGAFKGVRDEVASFLGVDDKSDRVHWRYVQCKAAKKKEAGYSYGHREAHLHIRIRIEILPATDVDPLLTAVRVLVAALTMNRQRTLDGGQTSCFCAERPDGEHPVHAHYCLTARQALATADALATFDPKELYNV